MELLGKRRAVGQLGWVYINLPFCLDSKLYQFLCERGNCGKHVRDIVSIKVFTPKVLLPLYIRN